MAAPTWPASLPQNFDHSGFKRGTGDGRLRTQMEAGPSKVRQRYRPTKPMSGTMLMTTDQFATLEAFIASDLAGGTRAFYFPQQPGPGTWLVRFAEDIATQSGSDYEAWPISLSLEIMPQ